MFQLHVQQVTNTFHSVIQAINGDARRKHLWISSGRVFVTSGRQIHLYLLGERMDLSLACIRQDFCFNLSGADVNLAVHTVISFHTKVEKYLKSFTVLFV